MARQSILYLLRSLADIGPPVSDAELLRRFLANDEKAFTELVRRHGQLVWSVCRHLTRSDADADDAFQATFLVLLKNARKVRDPGKLSSWLHGVAFKVCAKARKASERRQSREQATAVPEGNGSADPDSKWDRALAAVHEEVGHLPETLRVPFVLCCLEGTGVTEAAERLGIKLSTFSGRLARAKETVLLKLDARGLTLGIVVSVGVLAVPVAVAAKVEALAQVGFAVPSSILQLSQGVLGMSLKSVKMLAAAVIVTCGLGWSLGSGWMANAGAQQPEKGAPPQSATPQDEVKRLQAELDKAKQKAAEFEARQKIGEFRAALVEPESAAFKTKKWAYDLVVDSDITQAKFHEYLQYREDRGWEFNGSILLKGDTRLLWVFRKPVIASGATSSTSAGGSSMTSTSTIGPGDDAQAVEAEIKRLQERLAKSLAANDKKSTAPGRIHLTYSTTGKSLVIDCTGVTESKALAAVLRDLGERQFGKASAQVTDESGPVWRP